MLIDAHIHYVGDHPKTIEWMTENDVKLLNLCVAHEPGEGWRDQAARYSKIAKDYPDRYAWCTSFSLPDFKDDDYADKVIAGLAADVADGAIGCKLWKNIGMIEKKPDGQFLQIDDPIFTPIFDFMTAEEIPIVMHLAEPLECWQPLGENNSMTRYYTTHPEYHMYGRDDYPHHSVIMAARDNLVARHPKARFIGAHLASLEYDVKEIAARFEQFPNFAVDTCGPARIVSLGKQNRDEVREFFIKYAGRIMYGSDRSTKGQLELSDEELAESLASLTDTFAQGLDYYGTDKEMSIKGYGFIGLDLPEDAMEKLFATSAKSWYPGL